MKKILIPATVVALVCGAIAGVLMHDPKDESKPALNLPQQSIASSETVRQPNVYTPSFGAVNVPEEMKQHYTVNPKASQVVTGNSGTMLLIPDNAFTDKSGNPVSGKVKLELVEGITHEDIIKMNLGTMSDKGMLETGGMIYLGAKSESGEDLVLAEGKTIEAEIPAAQIKPGMQLWEGQENPDGSITWVSPEALNEGLREVPVETLAEEAAEKIDEVKPANNDSLEFDSWGWVEMNRVIIKRWGVIMGDTVFKWLSGTQGDSVYIPGLRPDSNVVVALNGNGAMAAVNFADKKFERTNIATAEFRSRLPFIRQACDDRISHCYADFPNRALWKSDLAAADTLEKSGCPMADVFRQFAKQKQGVVDARDPNTTAALDAAREKAIFNYSKKVGEQRAAWPSYSFGMKKLGWANVDCLYHSANTVSMVFNARIKGVQDAANTKVSLLLPGRGIFISGYRRPNGDYSFTHGEYEQTVPWPNGAEAYILAREGEGENLRFGLKKISMCQNSIEELEMKAGTQAELDIAMGNLPAEDKSSEVQILDDWFTKSVKNGTGCLCNSESGMLIMGVTGALNK